MMLFLGPSAGNILAVWKRSVLGTSIALQLYTSAAIQSYLFTHKTIANTTMNSKPTHEYN